MRLTPSASVPSFVRAPFACCVDECLRAATCPTGSCVRLRVAFVERTLWVWLVGSRALAALPRDVVLLGWHRQGHLACAFGCGCG